MAPPLPLRRVHLLTEQVRPAPAQTPEPAAPVVPAPPVAPPVAESAPVDPVVTARRKAASSGVLAMGAELEALRANVPGTVTPSRSSNKANEAVAGPSQPSTLSANVTRGSGGIEGSVAHQEVLGAPDLPKWEAYGQGSSTLGSGGDVVQTTVASGAGGRSQEQIQEVLDRNKGAMYTLYIRELRKDASLQGKLVMSITIAAAGQVTRCEILSSELNSPALEQQLVALVSQVDFGDKPGAETVTTRIPIEFFPQ